MDIDTFIAELQAYRGELVFNPWRDYDPTCDISPEAPALRRANLRRYLELRARARYLFIAEALGYQGGHFSGIAITSERILLGEHPQIAPESVLGAWHYERTSNPESALLNATQRRKGFNEPTDTVVWSALSQQGVSPFAAVLWNIFPFHPYKEGKLLSNRTPAPAELDEGICYARMLLSLLPELRIIAIGQKAQDTLSRYGVPCEAVRHPSMGGAVVFRAQVAELFGG